MLILESVEVENFLSYAKATLRFNRTEPTLVIGRNKTTVGFDANGVGKTALFEGVLYGLFGRTTSGRHGDSAVRNFGKNCVVRVKGTSSGKDFTITRYRKHDTHKNKVNFEYDGNPVEGSSKKDTQDIIEEVLGINFDLILQTCYFSPSSIQTFCSMTDSDQKNIFQALLDLDKWEEAGERVKAQEAILSQKKTKAKTELTVIQQVKSKDMQELQRLLKEIKGVDTSEQEAKLKINREFVQKNLGVEENIKKLRAVISDLAESDNSYGKTRQVKANLWATKEKLLAGSCPTCDSKIEPEVVQAEMDEIQLEIDSLEEKIQEIQAMRKKASARLNALETTKVEVAAAKAEIRVLEESLRSKQELKADKVARKNKLNKEIAETNKKIQSLKVLLDHIQKKEVLYRQLSTIFGVTGARTYLIKQVLPHLNKSLEVYSGLICPTISIKLDAQRTMTTKQVKNKFDIKVVSPIGAGYKSLSSGEAKRVDLCIVFSFLDLIKHLGKQTNFLILDEILDNLDQSGEDIAINQLKQLKQPNIFLISHKNSLSSRFSNVLLIEKENETSKILLDG